MDAVKEFRKEIKEAFIPLKKEEIQKMHKIQVEMLKDVIHFCEKQNLTYYLTGGSALGVIRHHGFIPWDDDIDIVLPKKDYKIFREKFEYVYEDKYSVEAPGCPNVGGLPFMKIRKKGTVMRSLMAPGPNYGIFIDVFPLEYAPESKIHRSICEAWYFVYRSLAYSVLFSKIYSDVFKPYERKCSKRLRRALHVKYVWGKILSIIPLEKWLNHFDKMVEKKESSFYVVASGIHRYSEECFPVDTFYPPRKGVFEGIEVNIPNKVESLLTKFYGDYMTPPKDTSDYTCCFTAVDFGHGGKNE